MGALDSIDELVADSSLAAVGSSLAVVGSNPVEVVVDSSPAVAGVVGPVVEEVAVVALVDSTVYVSASQDEGAMPPFQLPGTP